MLSFPLPRGGFKGPARRLPLWLAAVAGAAALIAAAAFGIAQFVSLGVNTTALIYSGAVRSAHSPAATNPTVIPATGNLAHGSAAAPAAAVPERLPPRELDDALRQFLRSSLTDKAKPIAPMVLSGDDEEERAHFCAQIEAFLRADGYRVRPHTTFAADGKPPQGLVLETRADPKAILLKIGVNGRL